MSEATLSLKALNRATLARQMLLRRTDVSSKQAIKQLVGLQAQAPMSPYVGLWSRVEGFQRNGLAQLLETGEVIKATTMRATLHLITSADYAYFRETLQPVLTASWHSITKRKAQDLDMGRILSLAKPYFQESPRSFEELSQFLSNAFPDLDVGALRYTVRMHLPMVQVPVSEGWSYPAKPKFALATDWVHEPFNTKYDLNTLIYRYLAAFGPATIMDMQTWLGMSKLKPYFEALRSQLLSFRDENRRELFDLPNAPRPDMEIEAPIRFLPEYDNLLLSHQLRTRVIPEVYRPKVFLEALRVRATFLIDGFVQGAWKLETQQKEAVLVLEPFVSLSHLEKERLAEEALKLLHFLMPEAKAYHLKFL